MTLHEQLLQQFQTFAASAPTAKSLMEHISQHLHEQMTRYNWVGFYLVDPTDSGILLVGPFVGSFTPNARIPLNKGLCGAAASSGKVVVVHDVSNDPRYLDAAQRALATFFKPVAEGGVTFTDEQGDVWFEEYLVSPPTHVLNGFIWAAWGVHDYFLATQDIAARDLFEQAVLTLRTNLSRYDLGFWSLYEQSGTLLPMVASPFYHRLHVVQLRVLHRLTGDSIFAQFANKWEACARSRAKRTRALCYKSAFKLCYY